jgi:hypothetical protein
MAAGVAAAAQRNQRKKVKWRKWLKLAGAAQTLEYQRVIY